MVQLLSLLGNGANPAETTIQARHGSDPCPTCPVAHALVTEDSIMSEQHELLLPHQDPMRWIHSLDRCEETTAAATVTFDTGHFAVADGAALETALVECMAQTVAAAAGARAQKTGAAAAVDSGVLAAVSGFQILAPPPLGKATQIEVHELTRLDRMVLVEGIVSCEGRVIATGNLKLYA
jgi:predicted hotdog family 3-hydroxylacyl-ACP dehydratase